VLVVCARLIPEKRIFFFQFWADFGIAGWEANNRCCWFEEIAVKICA